MSTVYFQPKGINPKYCEVGMISETDPEYIWYLDEPCKILISWEELKEVNKECWHRSFSSKVIEVKTIIETKYEMLS